MSTNADSDAREPEAPTAVDASHGTESRPGFLRRVAALVYDSLLLFAVLFAATAALLPFTGGEAVESGNLLYTAYLLAVSFVYFGWVWTHGGQSLGARAWRLRVVTADGAVLDWKHAMRRFAAAAISLAPCGAGFAWTLVDRRGLSLHDRLSDTEVVLVAKKS